MRALGVGGRGGWRLCSAAAHYGGRYTRMMWRVPSASMELVVGV